MERYSDSELEQKLLELWKNIDNLGDDVTERDLAELSHAVKDTKILLMRNNYQKLLTANECAEFLCIMYRILTLSDSVEITWQHPHPRCDRNVIEALQQHRKEIEEILATDFPLPRTVPKEQPRREGGEYNLAI